jgi:transcription elongation factor Elf1
MSGDHNMHQKPRSYLDDFECPRCGHCCQSEVSLRAMKHIKTWHERCEEHPDHQERIISERMIQERMQEEIDELRQALETEQEPVAWANSFDLQNFDMKVRTCPDLHHTVPLYTAPPKREWVGLTDEEIWSNGSRLSLSERGIREFARAIEAKLKEKNHGRGEQ